jgi:hypothetical protein
MPTHEEYSFSVGSSRGLGRLGAGQTLYRWHVEAGSCAKRFRVGTTSQIVDRYDPEGFTTDVLNSRALYRL